MMKTNEPIKISKSNSIINLIHTDLEEIDEVSSDYSVEKIKDNTCVMSVETANGLDDSLA